MPTAIHLHTKVLPAKRIEVSSPELQDDSTVEVIILTPTSEENGSLPRYPGALNVEYNVLIHKELNGSLTSEEAIRLKEICAEINAIDAASGANRTIETQMAGLREQLAAIRREVEALPDAQ